MSAELESSEETESKPQLFSLLPFLCNDKSLLHGWAFQKSGNAAIHVVNDAEAASPVVELDCLHFENAHISFPDSDDKYIGTPYPYLYLQIKNVNRFVALEVDIRDDTGQLRTFRTTNKQSLARLQNNVCSLPLKWSEGWNLLLLDLESLNRRVFATHYKYCVSLRIFANCRVRRVYFAESLYQESEIPETYQVLGMRNPLLVHTNTPLIHSHSHSHSHSDNKNKRGKRVITSAYSQ